MHVAIHMHLVYTYISVCDLYVVLVYITVGFMNFSAMAIKDAVDVLVVSRLQGLHISSDEANHKHSSHDSRPC